MIGSIAKQVKLSLRRKKYRTGAELSKFIAKDIRRDVDMADRLSSGQSAFVLSLF